MCSHSHQHWKHIVHRLRLGHWHLVEDPWFGSLRGMRWEDKVISTSRPLRARDGQSLENLLDDGERLLFSPVVVGQVLVVGSSVNGVDSLLHNAENLLDDGHASWRASSSVVGAHQLLQAEGCSRAYSSDGNLSPDPGFVAEDVTVDNTSEVPLASPSLSAGMDFLPDDQQLEVLLDKLHEGLEFVDGASDRGVVVGVGEHCVGFLHSSGRRRRCVASGSRGVRTSADAWSSTNDSSS